MYEYEKPLNEWFWVKHLILPIINELQSDELLKKCLYGQTQNSNEALNALIRSRVPKSTFVGKGTIEMGTDSVILHYNDGVKGVLEVLSLFGLSGVVTQNASVSVDLDRVKRMTRKSSEKSKKRRKQLRSLKKGFNDVLNQKEKHKSYVLVAFLGHYNSRFIFFIYFFIKGFSQ